MQRFVAGQPDGNIGTRSLLMLDKDLKKISIEKIAKLMVDHTVCKCLIVEIIERKMCEIVTLIVQSSELKFLRTDYTLSRSNYYFPEFIGNTLVIVV